MRLTSVILSLVWVTAVPSTAQSHTGVAVAVEIIAPSLTLSVTSARLDFGQISQHSGPVELHPESGVRSGAAYGAHSLASIVLTGSPGMQVTVEVSPPVFSSPDAPQFEHSWARSHECTSTEFVRLPDTTVMQAVIGESGCTQLQFGGILSANQAPQGRYSGEMTVQITPQM